MMKIQSIKYVSAVCFFAVLPAILHAEGSLFEQFFAPGNSAGYGVNVEPGQSGAPRVLQQSGRVSQIITQNDRETWTAAARASHFDLSQSPVIPETNLVVPDSLWDVQSSLSYLNKLGDRRQWGGHVAIGSASDKLFNSIHETEIQATANYMIPSKEHNAWLFLLSYSNNRAFLSNVPIPGFAYVWRIPDQGFEAILGFPFLALNYRPNHDWSFAASIFGTTNQSIQIDRRLAGPVRVYLRYERSPLSWLRADRDNNSNHLLYDEKKTLIGIKSPLGHGLAIDVSGGRNFDRRFYEARDAGHRNVSEATLANGWLVMTNLSLRWGAAANTNKRSPE